MEQFIAFVIGLVLSGLSALTGGTMTTYEAPVESPSVVAAVPALPEAPQEPPATPQPQQSETSTQPKEVLSVTPVPAPLQQVESKPVIQAAPETQVEEGVMFNDKNFVEALEQEIFIQSNVERVKNNLSAFKQDSGLAQISHGHSTDMLENTYFAHEDEDGCNSACRAKDAGYAYRALGENLFLMKGFGLSAKDAAALIVQGWMGSPGHRANLLRDYTTHTGIGVVVDGKTIYATAMYSVPR